MSIGGLFTAGRFAYAAVSGVDAFTEAVGKYAVKLVLRSAAHDRDTGEQIVERARANVPKDTGTLFNGITSRQDDDGAVIVEATAINERTGFDYARAVEFGHRTRGGVADAGFFEGGDDGRAFTAGGGGGEVRPQPFFFPAANEALQGRDENIDRIADQLTSEEGLN